MQDAPKALTVQFLEWLNTQPRTYAEAMDAWRTSCPRLSVWEDALADELIDVQSGVPMKEATVSVTERGRTLLHTRANIPE